MAPHWTREELDYAQDSRKSSTPLQTFNALNKKRRTKGIKPMKTLKALYAALSGKTHRRGLVETRGRKRILTKKHIMKIDTTRKTMYKKADGETEYHWKDFIKKSRVPKVSPETVARNMKELGIPVRARNPRKKVQKSKDVRKVRSTICKRLAKKPIEYFTKGIKAYQDNKRWPIPTTKAAMANLKRLKVRFHIRKPAEGLKQGFTKPDATKHKKNPGAHAHVCCVIINNKVAVWEYWRGRNNIFNGFVPLCLPVSL
jgi:hypothetical protein